MLRKRDVRVGKFYVNNERRIAREVLHSKGKTILFNTYHMDTGNSCGTPSICSVDDFVHWVDSEASPAEMIYLENLQYQDVEAQFRET